MALSPSTSRSGAPSGAAGGDLTGTYPNPGVGFLNGVAINNGPSTGFVLTGVDGSNVSYQAPAAAAGWVDDSAAAWTYATAATFTVAGDRTAVFQKGTRLRFTQTTVKYGVVASSSHSAGTTTVTIVVNTDYVLANAAISVNSYSYQASPQGYPGWFNWAPTITGFSAGPTAYTAQFYIVGTMCVVQFQNADGTSNATTFTITLPVAAAADTTMGNGFGGAINNSVVATVLGIAALNSGSTTLSLFRDFAATAWTNTGTKRFYLQPLAYRF